MENGRAQNLYFTAKQRDTEIEGDHLERYLWSRTRLQPNPLRAEEEE
jgi:hypothetical protein